MDMPTNSPETNQKKEKKRSPWLIVILILLLLMVCCCIGGAILCRSSIFVPDLLDRLSEDGDIPDEFLDFIEEFEGFLEDEGYDLPITPGVPMKFEDNICQDLSGNFEMQVLVGPSEIVGLDPFGIGSIPFSVEVDQGSYLVRGEGTIDFEDMLEEEWGTYTVFFDMVGAIDGVCIPSAEGGVLNFTFEMAGDQVFIVDSPGLQEEYPQSFEHQFDFSFPVVDGATESGPDGSWKFILHLDR